MAILRLASCLAAASAAWAAMPARSASFLLISGVTCSTAGTGGGVQPSLNCGTNLAIGLSLGHSVLQNNKHKLMQIHPVNTHDNFLGIRVGRIQQNIFQTSL